MEIHDVAYDDHLDADHLNPATDPSADQLGDGGHDSLQVNPAWGESDGSGDGSSSDGTSSDGGSSDGSGHAGTITVDVNGETRSFEETTDLDHDGSLDAAVVQSGPGEQVVLVDTDHDGSADFAATYEDGHLASVQHETSEGHWESTSVSAGGSDPTSSDTTSSDTSGTDTTGSDTTGTDSTGSDGSPHTTTDTTGSDTTGSDTTGSDTTGSDTTGTGGAGAGTDGSDSTISIEVNGVPVDAHPTYDYNGDGRPDTVIVIDDATGDRAVYVDTDGDGVADHGALYSPGGALIFTVHQSDGEWAQDPTPNSEFPSTMPSGVVATHSTDLGHSDGGSTDTGSSNDGLGATYAIDPQTGEWVNS
jgi:hypothetical protein